MSSDADYASFLEKANQDTSSATTSSSKPDHKKAIAKTVDADVPGPLGGVEAYYISDADEPFEPVSLKWEGGGTLDEDSFAKLTGHTGAVTTMSTKDFDPQGQYGEVIAAVEKATGGNDVKVFRVELSGARVEYWIVGKEEGKVVGFRAKAVES